jgi:endonuclease IV
LRYFDDKAVDPPKVPGAGKKKRTPLNQARGLQNMDNELVSNPEPSVSIELEDLKELARINPLAWEQLVHIADNRRNAERIKDLEAHLDTAHLFASNGAAEKINAKA